MKKSNLKDVAKLANVSLGTASKVINNKNVSQEYRTRVEEAMKTLHYTPNAIARSLKISSTKTIGIIIPDISNPIVGMFINGIESRTKLNNYSVMFYNTHMSIEEEHKAISLFQEKLVSGIIYTSNTMTEGVAQKIKESGIPCILLATDFPGFASVSVDNYLASYDAVSYLCRLGHKNIAMIAGESDDPSAGVQRIEGYKKALEEYNLSFNQDLITNSSYKMIDGYEKMNELLQNRRNFTAVFCASDEMAIGAIKALQEYGIKVPSEVSVVGFDGIPFSKFVSPSLTTIKQEFHKQGELSVKLLIDLINKLEVSSIVVPHILTIRNSVTDINNI